MTGASADSLASTTNLSVAGRQRPRGAEGTIVQDPEQGALAPETGVSAGRDPQDGATGQRGGAIARPAPPRPTSVRPASEHRPSPAPGRKRRKRRRGRKVFARDPAANGTPIAAVAPVETRIAPTVPVVQAISAALPLAEAGRPKAYAALDLGTNNCRLLVAVPTRRGQFRVIDAFSRIVRLGEGLTATGRLSDAAMDRALEALAVCASKLKVRDVARTRLIATEACRSAENGTHFLERVRTETGLDLEIIDRHTEARLAVSGCGSLVDRGTEGVVLFDIGGGSSEIALVDLSHGRSPRLANHIVAWTSLPIGVVSLSERFGGRHVTQAGFDAMVDHVRAMLEGFSGRDRLARVMARGRFHLLGTSGTVTTLAGVHLELARYDRRRVDGLWMDDDSVSAMIEKLLGWDFDQRVSNACIGPDRADLVLAGCAILQAIRQVWPSPRLRVADRGLREGMLSELMAEDGAWRRRRGGPER